MELSFLQKLGLAGMPAVPSHGLTLGPWNADGKGADGEQTPKADL